MKLRLLLPALALALCTLAAPRAQAQVGLYFNPIVSRLSNSKADSGPFAFLGQNSTSAIFGGVDIGGYYTFSKQPGYNLSVDVRDRIQHGDSASLNSFLLGLRVEGHPLALGLKPYAQISGGAGRTSPKLSPVHTTKAEYDIFAGVDKRLNRHVDWRIVEVGYGSLTTVSSETFGGGTVIPAAKMINFSTGFVFRIP